MKMSDGTETPLIMASLPGTLRSTTASLTSVSTSTEFPDTKRLVGGGDPNSSSGGSRFKVGVVGTGNYAIALTKRLVLIAGCDVVLGSRKPELRRGTLTGDCLCGVELASIADCVRRCDVLFVAIHADDFQQTLAPFAQLLTNKVVIDVSNRETRYPSQSNAEYLASILPEAHVVKAFNSISAYTMEDLGEASSPHVAYLAGNDIRARSTVIAVGQAMGFRVVDLGPLTSARWMEDFVLRAFSLWKMPVLLAGAIFTLWTLFIVYIYFIERPVPAFNWEQIFMKVINKPLCMTAITVLALTYLPGQLASVLQVWRGTKHRRFPQFLDTWLKCRKQLGLVAFFLATVHAIASVLMISPTYYSSWYHKVTVTLPANSTLTSDLVLTPSRAWMTWKGEAASMLGVLAFIFLAVVALTSIKSVGDALNWREWRCVHSQLSYGVLALSAAHVCVMGAPGWSKNGFPKTFKSITFLSSLLPWTVLLLKLVFSLPPLSGHLRKIRRGWERSDPSSSAGGSAVNNRRNDRSLIPGWCGGGKAAGGDASGGEVKGVSIVITPSSTDTNGKTAGVNSGMPASSCSSSSSFADAAYVKSNSVEQLEGEINAMFSSSSCSVSSATQTKGAGALRGEGPVMVGMELKSGLRPGPRDSNCGCDGQKVAPQTSFPMCQCSSL